MLFKCCFRRNNQVELYQQLLQKHWHLAARDYQVAFTELEFAIIRVSAAFERWQSDCLACCHGTPFSGSDNVILHVIRMHDRPKGISEIRRLLNRDDQSNLQYGVRKLLKAGLIEKTKGGTSKKDVTYQVFELGQAVTDKYTVLREELLLSLAQSITETHDLETITRVMSLLTGLYDQASCIAVTHKVPLET